MLTCVWHVSKLLTHLKATVPLFLSTQLTFTSFVYPTAVRPVSVKIVGDRKPLSAEKVSTLSCVSSGSRPPATITWWMGVTRLKHTEDQLSTDGNSTTSRLSLTSTIDDIGKEVTCRAENTHIASSAIEDTIKLDINCEYPFTATNGP